MSRPIALIACVFLAACGSIERTATVAQSLGQTLVAGPGDVVLRVDREKSLENALGKADIFGRSTKDGYSEIRFAGVEPSGVVVLSRKDVNIVTNETTMSRTPLSLTMGSASTSGAARASVVGNAAIASGSSTTSGVSTTLGPVSSYTIAVPTDSLAIRLQPGERRLPVAGYLIEILAVSTNSIEFRLSKQ